MPIKRICAWCGVYMGEKPGEVPDILKGLLGGGEAVTHGMCEKCKAEALEPLRKDKARIDKALRGGRDS